ncbi:hypothetical protein PMIT1327_00836 [Prochlorococcus marinus str. MIT 1327]|nr:hypothetical protein PMIT1312_00388 [Prochlorococcus marinus str. MIT 1312]KZR82573.1 hypothetical protein PMIT1327_00836 [Prochlorococcus marinus str. MIT 1327]
MTALGNPCYHNISFLILYSLHRETKIAIYVPIEVTMEKLNLMAKYKDNIYITRILLGISALLSLRFLGVIVESS